MTSPTLPLLAIAAATILYLLLHRFGPSVSKTSTSARRVVALTGPPDAGKTTLFSSLALGHLPKTHASLRASAAPVTLDGGSLTLVDLPGHPRSREQTSRALRDPGLAGVIFVVDVSALIRNAPAVAEELVYVLTNLCTRPNDQKLLILANKTDLLKPSTSTTTDSKTRTTALAIDRTTTLLLRELSRAKSARTTTTGSLDAIDALPTSSGFRPIQRLLHLLRLSAPNGNTIGTRADAEGNADAEARVWGERGEVFRFEDVDGVDVSFAAGSAVAEGGLDELRGWLGEV